MAALDKIKASRREVAEQVIKVMEQKGLEWTKTWQSLSRPYNPVSDVKYRGGNLVRLWMAAQKENYQDPRWCTYAQAKDSGWQVKRGEKGTYCEYWNIRNVEEEDPETGEKKVKQKVVMNGFYLYNAEQLIGIEPLPKVERKIVREYEAIADRLIESSECPVIEMPHNDRAFYRPFDDKIVLPKRDKFYTSDGFVETLLHEMGHSTGHPSRLNRASIAGYIQPEDETGQVDENRIENYPAEELVAELSSIMMSKDLGIEMGDTVMKNHAAYLNSWISLLTNDPDVLFRSAHAADKAADRILGNYYALEEKKQEETPKVDMTQDSKKEEKLSVEYFEPKETFEDFCKRYKFDFPAGDELKDIYTSLSNPNEIMDPRKFYRAEEVMKISKLYAEDIENGKILGHMVVTEVNPKDREAMNHLIDQNIKARNFDVVSALYSLSDNGKYDVTDEPSVRMVLRHSYDDLQAAGDDAAKAMEISTYSMNVLKQPEMIPALHQLIQRKPNIDLATYIDLAVTDPDTIKGYIENGTYQLSEDKQALADFLNNREQNTMRDVAVYIDGHICDMKDEWRDQNTVYVLGYEEESGRYYVQVTELNYEEWKDTYTYEYEEKPSHGMAEGKHIDHLCNLDIQKEHWMSFVGRYAENPAAWLEFCDYENGEFTVKQHGGPNDYIEFKGTPQEIDDHFHFEGEFRDQYFDMGYVHEDQILEDDVEV